MTEIPDRMITVGQAADLTGKSERWIQNLVSDGFISKGRKGEYSLFQVLSGVSDYYQMRILAKGSDEHARTFVMERRAMIAGLRAQVQALEAENGRLKAELAAMKKCVSPNG